MNILIYDENFHTIHGTVKYLLPVIDLLSKKNNITLLGDRYFEPSIFKTYYDMSLGDMNCQYLDFKESGNNLISHWQHIYKCKKISELSANYDVFINNKFNNHWEIDPKAKTNLAMLYFPLNPYHRWQQKESFSSLKNFLRKLLLSSPEKYNFVNKYQSIIANSLFTKKWFQHYWNQPDNDIPVIYPWIGVMDDKLELKKKNVICSVLRLRSNYSQNIDKMIDCFKSLSSATLKDWSLHIALGINVKASVNLLKSIDRLKPMISNFPIHLHINLDNNRINELYNEAKIYWNMTGYGSNLEKNPEHFESFGVATAEAMNSMCVPVVINQAGQRELIENNSSGVLVNNPAELRKATITLITKPDILETLARNAYARSLMFSKERFIFEFS
jgi:glycosyltransferase involved in cell wall biosynthesis